MRRAFRVCLVATALVGTVLASPAAAAVTCTFDAGTGVMTVSLETGDSARIVRSGDAITVVNVTCDGPTVSNTDRIVVTGTGTPTEVAIDLSGGAFAPGLTTEPDAADSEIELQVTLPAGTTLRIVGSSSRDHVVVGGSGINLNADEAAPDVDVTIAGTPSIVVEGGDGDDVLSAAGGTAEGSPVSGVTLRGQAGADLLLAGTGPNTLDGGEGADTVDYAAAERVVLADLGAGTAEHDGGALDTLLVVENLTGSPGDDTILGDAGDNVLRGGAGDDVVEGRGGDDRLFGDDGVDTVGFREASGGVEVDLGAGTSTGDGDDTLSGFENVTGSDRGDTITGDGNGNVLRGLFGGDTIHGRGGDDVIRGGKGGDRLFGGRGDDLLHGGHGKDQLDGGQGNDVCRGAPGPDSFVRCENYPTRG